ncbi:aspartate/glutamate racemase family protein [Burkholderia thailandensis]|uniref:aspartate/glutamate racemase family protein n=1 Tax=Burkholderia thailandensis TaxID=57975 RepID=UPI001EEE6918|nr:aspartate/glutamate racemase family protein [Burkholderia thailandensis]
MPAAQRTAVRSCVRPPLPPPGALSNFLDRPSTDARRDRLPAHRRQQRAALRASGRRARLRRGLAHARGAPRSARRRRARGRDRRRRAARADRRAHSRGADAVVLTCSTLGPSVDALAAHPKSIVRADAALARACARAGERIAVLCAAPSSERPTRALFEREARATGARMEVRIVPDAWARFHAGDAAGYRARLARAADAAYAQGFDVVAFAQASMAIAAPDVTLGPPPLTVPRAALARLLRT